jgi:hypothetical protein
MPALPTMGDPALLQLPSTGRMQVDSPAERLNAMVFGFRASEERRRRAKTLNQLSDGIGGQTIREVNESDTPNNSTQTHLNNNDTIVNTGSNTAQEEHHLLPSNQKRRSRFFPKRMSSLEWRFRRDHGNKSDAT